VSISKRTAQNTAHPFVFHLGPFRFESEIDIAELRASTGSGEIVVAIRLGSVPTAIEGAVPCADICLVAPTEFLLDIPGTARYYVGNGNEVRLDIVPGAPPADVSTYLLGSIFGVLCHQNGLLPLHASAIECGGAVTAFLGHSGAGKSTLAACLQRRGHRIVADDICLLQSDADSKAMRVVPVAGWLKLWSQSLQYLGETANEQDRIFSKNDKFRLYLPGPESSGLRLTRVVFLAQDPDPLAQPALQPLPQVEAIAGLIDMTYVGYVPGLARQQSRIFQQCARVLGHARAWRLTVPWDLDRMESVLDLLEKDILNPAID